MNLTFTHDGIRGDSTRHTARRAPGQQHAWEVSWLPGRLLDHNSATTAMVLAEVADARAAQPGGRLWPHVQGWAAELGLTAPDAITLISQPPGHAGAGKHGGTQAEPEAAGA
jgi:hypothetical protein